ncbi:hypothetical protein BJX64DRAFT_41027 [Aspergillus heterothallicus]
MRSVLILSIIFVLVFSAIYHFPAVLAFKEERHDLYQVSRLYAGPRSSIGPYMEVSRGLFMRVTIYNSVLRKHRNRLKDPRILNPQEKLRNSTEAPEKLYSKHRTPRQLNKKKVKSSYSAPTNAQVEQLTSNQTWNAEPDSPKSHA